MSGDLVCYVCDLFVNPADAMLHVRRYHPPGATVDYTTAIPPMPRTFTTCKGVRCMRLAAEIRESWRYDEEEPWVIEANGGKAP